MSTIRSSFSHIASKRDAARSQVTSLLDRLSLAHAGGSSLSSDGSPTTNGEGGREREEELRRALEAALGSLSALGGIYERREMRWVEEMRRLDEDREKVELLLGQVLGVGMGGGPAMGGMGMGMPGMGSMSSLGGMGSVNSMNGMGGMPGGGGGGAPVQGHRRGYSAGDSPGLKAPKPSLPI